MSELRQGTPEWDAERSGKLTASRFHEAIAKLKDGSWGAQRKNYKADIIAARLRRGPPPEQFTSAAMQWGIDTEPLARAAYSFLHDIDIVQVGFINHPTIAMSGCSPDGLIGDDGMIEAKCPNTATHIETLLGARIKSDYLIQVQWQLACSGRAYCDWVSFDPRLEFELQLHIERVPRDDAMIERLEREARVFLDEVDWMIDELRRLRPARIAA